MRVRTYLPFLLCLICAAEAAAQTAPGASTTSAPHNLMPVPASVRFNSGRLAVNKTFSVAARGHMDARLQAAVERFLRRLEGRTVMELQRGLAADAGGAALVIEAGGGGAGRTLGRGRRILHARSLRQTGDAQGGDDSGGAARLGDLPATVGR